MANIKFGNGWADARGKVGGVIYSKNKGGSYARNYTKPTNPRTPRQVTVRNRFAYVSSNWRLLTDTERNAWNYASSQVPQSNKVGERIYLSGAQYFNKQNMRVFEGGGTTIVTEPSQLVDIIGVVAGTVTATVTAGAIASMVANLMLVDGTTVVPADHELEWYATPVLSAGITRPQPSQYRFIDVQQATSPINALDVMSGYTVEFPLPAPNSNVWFKFKIVNLVTGQASQEFEIKLNYTTTP